MKRFERLAIIGLGHETIQNIVDSMQRRRDEFRGLGNYPAEWNHIAMRQDDVLLCVDTLILSHLQLCQVIGTANCWMQNGVNVALDYFYGDYQEDPEWAGYMERSPDNEGLMWTDMFRNGMLLATLAHDWPAAEKLSSWVAPWLRYDESMYLFKREDDAYFKILAAYVSQTQDSVEQQRELIHKSRFKRAKLLLGVLDAIQLKDQEAFGQRLTEYLRYFLQREIGKDFVTDWISVDASTLVQLALRQGLQLPFLDGKLADVVMTRETLGLET